ncbi:MAG: trigger factor [Chthonomonas sp.]|nr:trigger factor [Chthonomonas sp.]
MATTIKFKREDLNPCTVKISVTATPDQVTTGFDKAYKKFSKRLRVPGFRPGHAPKAMVAQAVDPNEILNAAADEIVRTTLNQVLNDEKIRPHDRPSVELTKIDEIEKACEYVAKVPLEPIVKLGDYRGLKVAGPKVEVSDAEVDAQLEEMRKRSGKREAVTDRGITEGDIAVVNIRGSKGDDEGRSFMIVAGQTFAALDKAIKGMHVEEMKKAELSFPADFQEKAWAGKKQEVQITIRSVNSVVLPELDDEFAKSGKELKAKDLGDLKAKLKEGILEAKRALGEDFINEALLEEIVKSSEVHVPDTMWEAVAHQRLSEEAQAAQKEGKNLEEVAKEHGMKFEEYVEKWQAEAKTQVQRAVIANTIFRAEKMRLENDDLSQSLNEMAYEYGVQPGQLFEAMKKNKNFTELEVRSVYRKVMKFLKDHATVEEGGKAKAGKSEAKAEAKPKVEAKPKPEAKAKAPAKAAEKKPTKKK